MPGCLLRDASTPSLRPHGEVAARTLLYGAQGFRTQTRSRLSVVAAPSGEVALDQGRGKVTAEGGEGWLRWLGPESRGPTVRGSQSSSYTVVFFLSRPC